MPNLLTLDLVEDLALAARRRRLRQIDLEPDSQLAPLIEFRRLVLSGVLDLPLPSWPAMRFVERASISTTGRATVATDGSMGLVRAERRKRDSDAYLQEFLLGLHRGLSIRGWPKRLTQAFGGILIELEENIHLHSRNAASAVLAYKLADGEAELVVADAGIGILESLKSGAYPRLSDPGEALRLALSDGGTRFGTRSGHGFGFRPLFSNLASHRADLRFRSDDQILSIRGLAPSLNRAQLRQQARLPGFMVRIVCQKPLAG